MSEARKYFRFDQANRQTRYDRPYVEVTLKLDIDGPDADAGDIALVLLLLKNTLMAGGWSPQ